MHLYFTRGLPEQVGKGEGNDGESYKADGGGLAAEGAPQLGNLSMGAKRVYQFLKSAPQNNEGLHIQTIAAGVRITVAEVLKGGDELLAESLIYTTVDDHTWAILEF